MKKLLLLIILTTFFSNGSFADCISKHYIDCLKLYDKNYNLQRAAKTSNMSREEYCDYLAETYCTPLF